MQTLPLNKGFEPISNYKCDLKKICISRHVRDHNELVCARSWILCAMYFRKIVLSGDECA
jgi:hypothetical protein